MDEPYAVVFGIPRGSNKSQQVEFPIVLNPNTLAYEMVGIDSMQRIMTTVLFWRTQVKDLLEAKKLRMQRERDEAQKKRDEILIARAWESKTKTFPYVRQYEVGGIEV